jgi:hypothetical protein
MEIPMSLQTTIDEAAGAEADARRMALLLELDASRPDAGDLERTRTQTAQLIIQNAELRAKLVPREDAEQWQESFAGFLSDDPISGVDHSQNTADVVRDAVNAAVARLDLRHERFLLWLAQNRHAAWIEAVEALRAWAPSA